MICELDVAVVKMTNEMLRLKIAASSPEHSPVV
jgi:hypothetical protein